MPQNYLLKNSKEATALQRQKKINHLKFIDDTESFAKNKRK